MLNCDWVIHTDKEDVVDAGVFEVVKGCGDEATHLLQIVQLQLLLYPAFHAEVVESLADICRVRLIVISDVFIAVGKGPHKVHQVAEV